MRIEALAGSGIMLIMVWFSIPTLQLLNCVQFVHSRMNWISSRSESQSQPHLYGYYNL